MRMLRKVASLYAMAAPNQRLIHGLTRGGLKSRRFHHRQRRLACRSRSLPPRFLSHVLVAR